MDCKSINRLELVELEATTLGGPSVWWQLYDPASWPDDEGYRATWEMECVDDTVGLPDGLFTKTGAPSERHCLIVGLGQAMNACPASSTHGQFTGPGAQLNTIATLGPSSAGAGTFTAGCNMRELHYSSVGGRQMWDLEFSCQRCLDNPRALGSRRSNDPQSYLWLIYY
ncbi:uncharacterized protein EI90DRAFT_3020755 [Cantharellus anzutake]|uniref:uncharacterized protein n=1 Tax=Cantharellus anzutake TaxID=1750568 RepID=UPI0019073512|nr:uncharacterized protein EI90DRAFT_3020755 [Cantharellus anzutake]KAF8319513.1 hypothetical protein EI90DRAFT_3020755 [Cantharellus anzutake]